MIKFGVMFRDALQALFRRPVTEKYPAEKRPPPERLRGLLRFNPDNCTGCCLCVRECPADALELITVDRQNKRFVLRYHADRCAYCAQCVQNCRFSCLEMSNQEWELAATSREPFTILYGDVSDIAHVMAKLTPEDGEPSE